MLIGFIFLYIFITIFLGIRASRRIKNMDDYTLAGRRLSMPVVGITIFATWFGSELILGTTQNFLADGIKGILPDIIGSAICLVLVSLFYARKMYRLRIVTLNDFFKLRYNASIELVTAIISVFTFFSWIAAQFVALALIFNTLFDLSLLWGIIFSAGIVVAYTYIGGMWAVTVTDVFQAVVTILGLCFVLLQLFGNPIHFQIIIDAVPTELLNWHPASGWIEWVNYIAIWLVFGIGAIPAQELYQRILAARSENAGAKGLIVGAILLFMVSSLPILITFGVKTIYPEILEEQNSQNIIPSMVMQHANLPVQILFFGALISAILSTASGALLAPATVIAENLIKPYTKNISDKTLLAYTRWSVILIASVAASMAYFNSSIHDLVVNSIIIYPICLLAPFTLGLYWQKASIFGVWLSMSVGMGTWLLCLGLKTQIEPWLFGCLASFVTMFLGSLLRQDGSYKNFLSAKEAISSADAQSHSIVASSS